MFNNLFGNLLNGGPSQSQPPPPPPPSQPKQTSPHMMQSQHLGVIPPGGVVFQQPPQHAFQMSGSSSNISSSGGVNPFVISQLNTVDHLLRQYYYYQDPRRVRFDIGSLYNKTPTFKVCARSLPGRPPLIYLDGTVQITHDSNTYHIPVHIWIPEGYPRIPPFCFVVPTPEMMFTKHPNVDTNGACDLETLRRWDPQTYDLNALVLALSAAFNKQPPVQAKAPATSTTATTIPTQRNNTSLPSLSHGSSYSGSPSTSLTSVSTPNISLLTTTPTTTAASSIVSTPPTMTPVTMTMTTPNTIPTASSTSAVASSFIAAAGPPPAYKPPRTIESKPSTPLSSSLTRDSFPSTTTPVSNNSTTKAEDFDVKGALAESVTVQLRQKLDEYQPSMSKDISELRSLNADVAKQIKDIDSTIQSLSQDKDQLEKSIVQLDTSLREVDAWFQRQQQLNNDAAMNNIDALTDPKDPLSKQLSKAAAEDMAFDDLFYALESAMLRHVIDSASFLKAVRTYSRDQFITRATMKKIIEAKKASS
eukprot:TRINITY_DN1980_c2_g1_i2.p1 TRINITY_DN1980_c2_g1~~TRINITY_DN1980_c2_g1_i2.p1  ORF type:complete len:532 (-),score=148.48 TRINITY_DN1980_c2_g1_i2:106-1701(-)